MFNVLKAWHPMIGVDFHIPVPPGPPVTLPPAPYPTMSVMIGTGITSKYTPTVNTHFLACAMVKGTDIGPMIPHIPGPPSVTIMIESMLSGSKSHFGPMSVNVKDQYGGSGNPAAAVLFSVNPNLNCGFPMPTPTGFVLAFTTVTTGMTLGDILAGALSMLWDFLVQSILNKVSSWVGTKMSNFITKMGEKLTSKISSYAASRAGSRYLAREAWKRAGKNVPLGEFAKPARESASKFLNMKLTASNTFIKTLDLLGPIKLGFFAGSPLGMSSSNLETLTGGQVEVTSGYDRGMEQLDEAGGDTDYSSAKEAVDNYLNSPQIDEPTSTPTDSVSPGSSSDTTHSPSGTNSSTNSSQRN